jgi:hypothetical protein
MQAPDLDAVLVDLLIETNFTLKEIANDLNCPEAWVRHRIRELDLAWIRRSRGFASRGQAALTAIFKKLLPGEEIRTEEPIGDRLLLDVYCPGYMLGAEFHGRQHFEYTRFFHPIMEDFNEMQRRDQRKMDLCNDLGIALVVVRYNDNLTEDSIYERILQTLKTTPAPPTKEKKTLKGNAAYETYKRRQREYNRMLYQKMKNTRKHGKRD